MSERRSAVGSGKKRSALAALDSAEKGAVLEELLRSQPALRAAAERIAREHLADAEHEAIAEEVEWALRSLSSEELSGRAVIGVARGVPRTRSRRGGRAFALGGGRPCLVLLQ
ncbi:MAG TPA: hypothetical protein VMU55_02550 [Solirubrobacteraceae bacterium]|nr:hypothetical protein [Solirubrobacteraceae bacterium]